MTNDRFLRALRRQSVDYTPVWIMRQAGRYLPEYRATRTEAGSFLNLCKTPELACAVTLQPTERFALDAAIIFSDILTVPDAMGLGLQLLEGSGPRFERPVRSRADVKKLGRPDPLDDLGYVMQAIRLVKESLGDDLPLIGFAGSPWTVATYAIEGHGSREFTLAKSLLYDAPDTAHLLLDKIARATTDYLNAQIDAGADAVMLFDTWGGVLSTAAYLDFSLRYMNQIVAGLRSERGSDHVPSIIFTKGGGQWLELIAASGCSAVGLDWTIDIGRARARIGHQVALQGNLDPAVLRSDNATIRRELNAVLAGYGSGNGHVFNLGHGITPDIDPDKLAYLIDTVHDLSRAYH